MTAALEAARNGLTVIVLEKRAAPEERESTRHQAAIIDQQTIANLQQLNVSTAMLRPLLRGLAIQPNINQRVSMMSRTLLSRPNLEKLMRMTDLDLQVNNEAEREEMLDRLREVVDVRREARHRERTSAPVARRPGLEPAAAAQQVPEEAVRGEGRREQPAPPGDVRREHGTVAQVDAHDVVARGEQQRGRLHHEVERFGASALAVPEHEAERAARAAGAEIDVPFAPGRGEIVFDHVGFAYENQARRLYDDFSLRIAPGERVTVERLTEDGQQHPKPDEALQLEELADTNVLDGAEALQATIDERVGAVLSELKRMLEAGVA